MQRYIKVSIHDLVGLKLEKLPNSSEWRIPSFKTRTVINKIWIQGIVKQISGDFGDQIEVQDQIQDSTSSVTVRGCLNIPKGLPPSLYSGEYCQILGQIIAANKDEKKGQNSVLIQAQKIVHIRDPVLREMWPLEVKEMKRII